jgi:hypothetical protein
VAARSKVWVCGRSLAGIVGSNSAGGMDSSLLWVFVLSGKSLWLGLITHPEESYRMWCVWVWPWSLDNEGTLAHWGLLCLGNNQAVCWLVGWLYFLMTSFSSASSTMGIGSSPWGGGGVKRPGGGFNYPPLCGADVKEKIQLCLNPLSVPSWQVTGWTLLYFTLRILMHIPKH